MNLTKEKTQNNSYANSHQFNVTQEMLKSLCFNCESRNTCTWKEERKIYCEHFE